MGAIVAVETARQLKSRGHKVGVLAVLDGRRPNRRIEAVSILPAMANFLANVVSRFGGSGAAADFSQARGRGSNHRLLHGYHAQSYSAHHRVSGRDPTNWPLVGRTGAWLDEPRLRRNHCVGCRASRRRMLAEPHVRTLVAALRDPGR